MARSAGQTAAAAAEETSAVETAEETSAAAEGQEQEQQQEQQQTTAETGEAAEGETQQQQQEAATAPPAEDWKDRRIRTLTARFREVEREMAALKASGAADPDAAAAAEGAVTRTAAELEALVDQRAAEKALVTDWTRRCNETVSEGRKAFGEAEFNGRVQGLLSLVDGGNPRELQAYNTLLLAAMETGQGAEIIHQLGGDLDKASRLLDMTPVRMGIEMARMVASEGSSGTGAPSAAPRPIRPVNQTPAGSRTPIAPDDPESADRLSTAEWMRRREAQAAVRR